METAFQRLEKLLGGGFKVEWGGGGGGGTLGSGCGNGVIN